MPRCRSPDVFGEMTVELVSYAAGAQDDFLPLALRKPGKND